MFKMFLFKAFFAAFPVKRINNFKFTFGEEAVPS